MSIYATLWTLKFPKDGDDCFNCDCIDVTAQAVPAHIGSPTPAAATRRAIRTPRSCRRRSRRMRRATRPSTALLARHRPPLFPSAASVVFITEHTRKGTDRSGQEYASPLLVLTGEEYARISFDDLHRKICDALRGNRAPIIAEMLLPDGTHKIIRGSDQP